jgi:hypothetical protein
MRGRPAAVGDQRHRGRGRRLKEVAQGGKNAYHEEAFRMGLFHTNWFVTEINDVLNEFRKAESGRDRQGLIAPEGTSPNITADRRRQQVRHLPPDAQDGATVDEAALEAMKVGHGLLPVSRSIKACGRRLCICYV